MHARGLVKWLIQLVQGGNDLIIQSDGRGAHRIYPRGKFQRYFTWLVC
jgi:hypothetical protein